MDAQATLPLHSQLPRDTPGSTRLTSSSLTFTAKGPSPLASKVTTVLSTSYSDTEFRDALALLDRRQVRNDAETRRQIRMDLQKEVIDGNGEILSEFGRVADQLHKIGTVLDRLNAGYDSVKKEVNAAHVGTNAMLSEATSLVKQREQVEKRQKLLESFRGHFTMTSDEITTLTATAEPVDGHFFDALAKAKKINKDCEVLLGFEKQTLGLELMQQTSNNINLGFQKLYRWIQKEFKTLNLENPQMSSSMRRGLRILAERPSLFQHCLDFFSESRERILSDSFYAALTGSSALGIEEQSSKPIDLTAHDPLRYVGDMLAWIHSATVSEREALEVLFVAEGEELALGLRTGRDAEIWRLVADETDPPEDFNAVKALDDLVNRNISGAARVLRKRVEQVIQTNEDIIPGYKLANLLDFYLITFAKLLGEDSILIEAMRGLQAEAMRQFRALVREHIATLQGEFQQTPADLGPPSFLQECLSQLEAFIQTYDSSLAASEDRERGFEGILSETFDPFMSGCENMASSMTGPRSSIFLINCYLAGCSSLKEFDFTRAKLFEMRKKIETESKTLVACQHQWFRDMSGLNEMLAKSDPDSINDSGRLEAIELRQASQQLDDFLPSAWMDAMESLKHLQDSTLARHITADAAERFCGDFEQLEKAVIAANSAAHGSQENAGELRTAFPRTTAEIRVLLS